MSSSFSDWSSMSIGGVDATTAVGRWFVCCCCITMIHHLVCAQVLWRVQSEHLHRLRAQHLRAQCRVQPHMRPGQSLAILSLLVRMTTKTKQSANSFLILLVYSALLGFSTITMCVAAVDIEPTPEAVSQNTDPECCSILVNLTGIQSYLPKSCGKEEVRMSVFCFVDDDDDDE